MKKKESAVGLKPSKIGSKVAKPMKEMDSEGCCDNRFLAHEGMMKESTGEARKMHEGLESDYPMGFKKLSSVDACEKDMSGPYPMVNEKLRYK